MFGVARRLEASDRAFRRFLIGAMALGFALLAAAGLMTAWTAERTGIHSAWVAHSLEVEVAITQAQMVIEQGETTRRGYLLAGQPIYRDTYRGFETQLPTALRRLAMLTVDNPRQQRDIAEYRGQVEALVEARRHSIALVEAGRRHEAVQAFVAEAAFQRPKAIRATAARMLAEERRLLAIRDLDQRRSLQLFYVVLAVAGGLLVLLAVVITVTLLRFTRDLHASRDALAGLNETLEEQVAARTAALRQ